MSSDLPPFLRIEKLTKGTIKGYNEGDEILLGTDSFLIARPSKKPDVIPPNIEILGDDYISRNHAEIYYSSIKECFMLRDRGSRHGTFLNGHMLETDQSYPLSDCDSIGLAKISGQIRVIFKFRESEGTLGPDDLEIRSSKDKGLSISLAARKVSINGEDAKLTKKEFDVLEVLYNNRGNACSLDDISWEVWGAKGASDELIAKHISRLRKKIDDDSANPRYIITLPGRHKCYRLDL